MTANELRFQRATYQTSATSSLYLRIQKWDIITSHMGLKTPIYAALRKVCQVLQAFKRNGRFGNQHYFLYPRHKCYISICVKQTKL